MATNGTIIQAMITIPVLFGEYSLMEQSPITHVSECNNNYYYVNHMVNTFYPIENNAITNKLLLRYTTRLKSPEQEKNHPSNILSQSNCLL